MSNLKEDQLKVTILDLGCGSAKIPNALGVDNIDLPEVDIVHDLNSFPYPFEDASFECIYLRDVLEHLINPIKVINECYRILKPNFCLIITVVHWNHRYSYSDIQHLHRFETMYFEAFCGGGRKYYKEIENYYSKLDITFNFDGKAIEKYGNDEEVLLEKAYYHSNVLQGMTVTLLK